MVTKFLVMANFLMTVKRFQVIKFNQKAQTWSVDIILAVVLFMGAFFLFYVLLSDNTSIIAGNLQDEASIVIKQVSSGDAQLRIVDKNEINITKINELKNISYDELKQRLRIQGDFCIFLEDENGNVILINNTYAGIGSPEINISGVPCSQK